MNENALRKLVLHTSYNSFKNTSFQSGFLTLPAALGASPYDTSVSFVLPETASFLGAYMYSTDYAQYFEFSDSAYHDAWRQINNNNDNLIFTSGGLYNYSIKMVLNGTTITFNLHIQAASSGTPTVTHPTHTVPITVASYRLAN